MFNVRYPSAGDMDFQCHEMRSVAAAVALERISQRMKVSTSAVLIALTAVTVARLSGNRRAIFKVVVGNRREEHLKAYISPLVQDGVISIDTDGDFDTVIRRAWPASILAYSRSRYRPSDLQVAALAYEAEQGHDGDPRVALKDARFSEEFSELPDPVDRAGLWELCDETVISHVFSQERVDVKLFIEISQSTDCLQVTLLTDGTYVPSGMIPQILRNMETLLIRESLQEAPDDPPFAMLPRDHDWALVEGNWVQPAHLCALLASLPGVDRAELVDPAPDRSADGLTCRLFVNAEFNLEGAALRREAVEVLRGHEDILIPSRFDIQPSAGECQ